MSVVDNQAAISLRIGNFELKIVTRYIRIVTRSKNSRISYLASAFTIKGCPVEYDPHGNRFGGFFMDQFIHRVAELVVWRLASNDPFDSCICAECFVAKKLAGVKGVFQRIDRASVPHHGVLSFA